MEAIQHILGAKVAKDVKRSAILPALRRPPRNKILLVDEPGELLDENARRFLEDCQALTDKKKTSVVVAMTPREYGQLETAAGGNLALLNPKDLHYLEPLNPDQGRTIAGRADWALDLLPRIPATWQREPFLLELLLSLAEELPELRANVTELVEVAIRRASLQSEHDYPNYVYGNGLNDDQRLRLREAVDGRRVGTTFRSILYRCGLLDADEENASLADPVLHDHLPPTLRIHQISDIHVGQDMVTESQIDDKAKGAIGKAIKGVADKPSITLREAYRRHLAELGKAAPHLLIASGDMTSPAKGVDGITEVHEWLQKELRPLLVNHRLLESNDPRICVIGGNHDVDRAAVGKPGGERARHLPFAMAFKDYPRPQLELPPEKRDGGLVNYKRFGMQFLLFGSSEVGQEIFDTARVQIRDALTGHPDAQKAIDALNEEYTDPGLVAQADLDRAVRDVLSGSGLRIAVLHHPPSPLPPIELAAFGGLLNAGRVKEAFLKCLVALALHGHLHIGWFGEECWAGEHDDWVLRIASAPSLSCDRKSVSTRNGFNEIEINREGKDAFFVTVRRFEWTGQTCEPTARLGPFSPGRPRPTAAASRSSTM